MSARPFPGEALRKAMVARSWLIKDMALQSGVARDTVRAALASQPLSLRSEGLILAAIARTPVAADMRAAMDELAS